MPFRASSDQVATRLFGLSIGVFFIGGFLSSAINLFVPRMTLLYGLQYQRALLIQLAFHASYLLFAVPIALAIMRIGYMRAAAAGLAVMAASCLSLLWAHGLHSYALVLASLLSLSAGITFLQIANNTVVSLIGGAHDAAFRLNLLQAFNALGTVLGPLLTASYLLGAKTPAGWGAVAEIAPPFVAAILLLVLLALAFAAQRDLLQATPAADTRAARVDWREVSTERRLLAGSAAIFLYVGAEVAIGALLTNYLVLPQVLGVTPITAARLLSLFWGGAMVGRVLGAFAMRRISPPGLLMAAAVGAAVLTLVAASTHGLLGAVALIAVGLCDSIMYPTIYVLALPRAPESATPGGMLLCMAVVGGAIIPMLTGMLADRTSLAASLLLPAFCYLLIAAFARTHCRRESIA